MRRHRDQRADGDDTGAADAGHQQVERLLERCEARFGQCLRARERIDPGALLLPPRRTFDGDKTRAEAVDARKILVAGRKIDLAFAAERRLLRLDAEAIGLDRTIAAALA